MKCILLIFTLLVLGCSPIKRHARLVKKFPYVHTVDSVKLIDTVQLFTTAVYTDTIVKYTALLDGVTINKDNLTIEVLRIRDSIYINGSCDTVFIDSIVERMIPVKYYESVNTNKIPYYLYFVIALLIFLLVRKK